MKRLLLILVAFALLPAAACSLRQKPTGENYYAQGQLDFATKEYKAAIENYQNLIDKFPFSPYAEDAEMKIGLAHYQQKDYAEAIGALDDFQRMHPTSKNLELVTYYIGLSYYDQIGREDQDQGKTVAALKRFQELEQRFPEGDFAELAHEKVLVCREMLARNEMIVGNYYYKRANFRAAESRFAELLQKYPETPVAPDALFELGISLEKEGKRYSAAQAFAAVEKHFPNTGYAKRARTELAKLHQPIDTEEDPLPLVLAETGYGGNPDDSNADKVVVRQRSDVASAAGGSAYGSDGLPVLNTPSSPPAAGARASLPDIPPMMHAPDASQPDLPNQKPGEPNMMRVPAPGLPAPTGSIAGAAAAQARAMTGAASSAPEPSLHQMESGAGAPASAPLSLSEPPTAGPATLKTIRLSSNDPPLSVVLELSGPVSFDKNLQSNSGGSTATVVLKDVTPDSALQTHLVFDKSIFKDCNVSSSKSGTTVTLNMQPVAHFAVVPLEGPPRLLVTFTPQAGTLKTSAAN
ncbi:MAG: outer membrane protein assembly factor BamD [Candidatus Binatus sp.]|jgi:outer membrane protein assembly factor BamD|uniref:outer membrane protein assembly factor BamD n=1 Tax=Candidatus Binatus sp. TaxID=2811406 RepID=UPI003D0F16D0